MPRAILSAEQYRSFQVNGLIPEFTVNGEVLPAFAMSPFKSGVNVRGFTETPSYDDFWYLYRRCDIAANCVDIVPRTLWGSGWILKCLNSEGQEVPNSPLKVKGDEVTSRLSATQVFMSAHIFARCTGLGIVVLGFADDKMLSEPLESASDLSYMRAYANDDIEKINFYSNIADSRYGDVESYVLKLRGGEKLTVHSSRVIRVCEKNGKNDVRGVSVLEAPFDLLKLLKNTDYAAGEAYYQNASPLYCLSWDDTSPDSIDAEPSAEEKQQMKSDMEDLHVKKRFIKPKSWTLDVVQGSGRIADPNLIWDSVIERIAGATGIPKQLLLGTSAGALASGETNLEQWYSEVTHRQRYWATPIVNEFYRKLQDAGVLPEGNFTVEWATLWAMDKKEEAEIQRIKVSAAVDAVSSGLMSVEEARVKILGLPPNS